MRDKPLILIVDDEANFREIFGAKLAAAGFEVVGAKNAKEALKQSSELVPDLILMDIHMPETTGTDLALQIKQEAKTKNVKIAFLTNMKEPWPAMSGDHSTVARELGMEDFMEKGSELDTLVKRVQELLNPPAPTVASEPASPVESPVSAPSVPPEPMAETPAVDPNVPAPTAESAPTPPSAPN